ncbi:hypothetical protein, partial [Desulfoplanes sp.]
MHDTTFFRGEIDFCPFSDLGLEQVENFTSPEAGPELTNHACMKEQRPLKSRFQLLEILVNLSPRQLRAAVHDLYILYITEQPIT